MSGSNIVEEEGGFLSKKTKIILVVLAILSLAVGLGCYFYFRAEGEVAKYPHCKSSSSDSQNGVCKKDGCKLSAKTFTDYINPTVNPCEDFYKYACRKNKMDRETDLPITNIDQLQASVNEQIAENLEKSNSPLSAIKNAQILYRSCLKSNTSEHTIKTEMRALLKDMYLSEIPLIFTGKRIDHSSMATAGMILRTSDIQSLFTLDSALNPSNSEERILRIRPHLIGYARFSSKKKQDVQKTRERSLIKRVVKDVVNSLNGTILTQDSLRSEAIELTRRDYRNKTIAAMMKIVPLLIDDINSMLVKEVAEKMVDFVETIAQFGEWTNTNNGAQVVTVDQLQKETDAYVMINGKQSELNWMDFFATLQPATQQPNSAHQISKDTKLLIPNLEALKKLALAVNNDNTLIIDLFMWWTVVEKLIPYSYPTLQKAYMGNETYAEFADDKTNRRLYCAVQVKEKMSFAVSRLFFNSSSLNNEDFATMFNEIKKSFEMNLDNSTMFKNFTRASKSDVIGKKNKMKFVSGYPKELSDDALCELYGRMPLSESRSYLNNSIQVVRNNIDIHLSQLQSKYLNKYWRLSSPLSSSAFYDRMVNAMYIPYTYFQPPIYSDTLEVLNYGGLGFTLGHEFMHGFDNEGFKYDSNGNHVSIFGSPWAPRDRMIFQSKVTCFKTQILNNKVKSQSYELQLDENIILAEQIADTEGLRLAYNAYKSFRKPGAETKLGGCSDFTEDQLFFLSFSQTLCERLTDDELVHLAITDNHAPGRYRINSALKNFAPFSEAWKCDAKARMNPKDKCQLW